MITESQSHVFPQAPAEDDLYWAEQEVLQEERTPGLVSVMIRSYNRAALLEEALASVYAQNYDNIEVIVVDDGSPDNSAEVLSRWEKNHPDLKVIRKPNGGICTTANRCMKATTGELLQFLDCDDILHPEKISLQIAQLQEHPEADFVVGGYAGFEKAPDFGTVCHIGEDGTEINLKGMVTGTQAFLPFAALFRAESLRPVGAWDERLPCHDDTNFLGRVVASGCRGFFYSGPVVYYRYYGGNQVRLMEHPPRILAGVRAFGGIAGAARKAGTEIPPELFLQLGLWRFRLALSKNRAAAYAALEEAEQAATSESMKRHLKFLRLGVSLFGIHILRGTMNLAHAPAPLAEALELISCRSPYLSAGGFSKTTLLDFSTLAILAQCR